MSGKQSTQTATNTSEPWAEQKPYITGAFSDAKKLYDAPGPSYFPGSTVAGFSPEQTKSFDMTMARATEGNKTMNAAEGWAQDTLAGKYSGDPYQGQVFNNISSQVMPKVNSQFTGAGRYGSGAHAGTATRALTESFAPYASQMYQQGMDRMQAAAGMAPMFAQDDYNDIGAIQGVGDMKQRLAQGEIDDAKARYDYAQDLPANKLGQYMGFIGGNYGGTTTSATPYYKPSPWSQALGAGLSLGGLFG
jgi:hypothetical protein